MRLPYWKLLIMAAMCCIAVPSSADERVGAVTAVPINVEFRIHLGKRVTDPLLPLPYGAQLRMTRFIKKKWDVWPCMAGMPDSNGYFRTSAMFPIDRKFVNDVLNYAKGKTAVDVPVGIIVTDLYGQRMQMLDEQYICVEITTFGKDRWPNGVAATIVGQPNEEGVLPDNTSMHLPINTVTVSNFNRIAKGEGQ